jgi:putative ABC transport system permease protein
VTRRRVTAAGAAVALYALVLRMYPREFRERCGAPMLRAFDEACRAARHKGLWPFIRETAAELANAVAGIWRSRRDGARTPPLDDRVPGAGRVAALVHDTGYALRRLRSQPAIVIFTVLTLGFAIAANAAIFSIVDAALLRPSPFREAGQLYNLLNQAPGGTFPGLSRQKLRQWRSETGIFETVEAYRPLSVVVTGGVEPEELQAAQMSPGLLTTLGAAPLYGRMFLPDEGRAGFPRVVLVSETYWRARLGRDPLAIGRTLTISGQPHEVVGVLPSDFHFPSLREAMWLPLDADARPAPGEGVAHTIARVRSGLTLADAKQRIDAAVARLEQEQPLPTGWKIVLHQGTLAGADEPTRRAVLILFGAVGLVLLTACANVANLLLSRAVERQREFSIRLVLGASRIRLVRELLIEGLLLGIAAGAAGLVAAHYAVDTLVRLAPGSLLQSTTTSIGVDARVILFGFGLAILTGVLCNLPPALRFRRAQGNQALSGRTKSATTTALQQRLRGGLVVAEIALAVVLLVGAALLVRSFMKLNAIDIGFNPDKLLAVTVGVDTGRYGTEAARAALLGRVSHDVAQLPGVSGVALASGLPPSPGTLGLADVESEAGPCGPERVQVVLNLVSPNYFGLMGIPTPQGRPLRDDDPPNAVVVSDAVSRMCGGSLTGRRVRLGARAPWLTVVGVAGDVKTMGLTSDIGDLAVYLPFTSDSSVLPIVASLHERQVVPRRLLIRAERPLALVDDVKRVLWAHDPDQPVLQAVPAADLMADSIRRERFMLALMTLFSAVALSLASAGIFGVLAYIVAQRANEIGIRMALGATSGHVLSLVVGQGLRLAAVGAAAGLAGAFVLSKLLAGLLYDVNPRDPVVFVVMPLLVFGVALLASWIPTIRALKVDPASALRVE